MHTLHAYIIKNDRGNISAILSNFKGGEVNEKKYLVKKNLLSMNEYLKCKA